MDISCQHLGDEYKLMGFCVPFGHRVGKCTFLEYVSFEYICWYWIYHANTWGMNVSWRVSLCPSGTGWGNIYFGILYIFWEIYIRWVYLLVMDISCQHLGDECKLEGFLVPFGHRVGKYIFWGYYIFWEIYISWIYLLVMDISCQHLGDE